MKSVPYSSQHCVLPNRADKSAGFTLVELLIAIMLLGLVAFMSVGSLRFGARVWDRTTENSEADGRVRAVQHFIREQLGRSVVVKPLGVDLAASGAIRGTSQAIEFFAPLSASQDSGSIVKQRLALGETGFGLTWTEIDQAVETASAGDRTAMLLPDVTQLRYDYLAPGRGGDKPIWLESWEETALPLLIRVRIEFEPSSPYRWPELLVAPRPIIP